MGPVRWLGVLPALVFFFWYNLDRFGDPLQSGYALATLPTWLQAQRELGLFSTAHIAMNLDYLFWKTPALTAQFPYFRPDGLGMSVLSRARRCCSRSAPRGATAGRGSCCSPRCSS